MRYICLIGLIRPIGDIMEIGSKEHPLIRFTDWHRYSLLVIRSISYPYLFDLYFR